MAKKNFIEYLQNPDTDRPALTAALRALIDDGIFFAELTVTGGTANAVQAALPDGVLFDQVQVFYIDIGTPNAGNVTVSVDGAAAIPALDYDGTQFIAGAWDGRLLLSNEGTALQSIIDRNTSVLAAQYAAQAAQSADLAGDKADAAEQSRQDAANEAGAAAGSATLAGQNADDAAAILLAFDKRYLGSKTADPATDNQGDPLLTGAQYFNETADSLRIWDGAAWIGVGGIEIVEESDLDPTLTIGMSRVSFTVAQLKAVNTARYNVAYLAQAGREGTFIWRSGDYAARIAADTAGALYLKADAVAATVGAWVRQHVGIASPLWFGAVGDGATNDAAAMALALAMTGTGQPFNVLDLGGRVYRCDSALTPLGGLTMINGTISFAAAVGAGPYFASGGSDGTAQTIAALSATAASITVTNGAAFAAKDLIWISSTDLYGYSAATKGEWQQVSSVSGNVLNLYGRLRDSYATNVKVAKPSMKRQIQLRGVTFIGGGDAQNAAGVSLQWVKDVVVRDCVFRDWGDRALEFRRGLDIIAQGNVLQFALEDLGTGYGILCGNGIERAAIVGNSGSDMRHGVVVGGEDGVDRFITITGNTFTNMPDSGIDSHPNAEHVIISDNTLDMGHYSVDADANRNGITAQGAHLIVTNNTIRNCKHVGIHLQLLTSVQDDTVVCEGNTIITSEASTIGVFFDSQKIGGTIRGVSIVGNVIEVVGASSRAILCEAAAAGGNVVGLVIAANRTYSPAEAITLTTAASKIMQDTVINGNNLQVTGNGVPVISMVNGTSGAYLTVVNINGNIIRGGNYGIRTNSGAFNADRVAANGNIIQAFATAATIGTLVQNTDNFTT